MIKKLNTPCVQNRKWASLPDVTQSKLILRSCSDVTVYPTIYVSNVFMYSARDGIHVQYRVSQSA